MNEVANKRELRARLRGMRDAMGACERSACDERIAEGVRGLDVWHRASVVYTYLSFGAEVNTRALIEKAWDEGKVVALPRCVQGTREMRWFAVDSLEGLELSRFGVEEPSPDPHRELDSHGGPDAIALVPGLAFDRRGYRMGYGGGFYDRFLTEFAGISVGLCRDGMLLDALLWLEPHDRPVDLVVCG